MSDYWKNKWEEVKNDPIPSWQQEWNENNKVTVNGVTYTPQELANAGNRSGRDLDDYYYYTQQLAKQAESQAPKVSVSNGKLKISAPQAILDSNLTKQLKDELKTLVGADLNDSNVQSAISTLNKELQENFANSAVEQTLGWTPDEYKDYQYAIQTVNTVNPLKSTNKLKWATDGKVLTDDNGKAIMKTPAEWIKYWREKYNTDDRYDMYQKSLQSNNPYERTMALVMGAGGSSPVYGFDGLEKLGQFWGNAGNQMKKFPEGTFRTLFGNINQANNIDSDQKNFKLPTSAFLKNDITNEEQFDKKVQSIRGKKWEDLSDNEKAFVLIVSHGTTANPGDALLMSLSRSKLEQLAGLSGFRYSLGQFNEKLQPEIENMDSKTAVASILAYADFDDYKRMHDSYMTWDNWQKEMDADDERLAKNADWAGIAAGAGNVVGTIGRYLWEDAVLRGLTGGISPKSITNPKLAASATVGRGLSMNSVSDILGEKIVSNLASHGISPVSKAGKSILQFSANLVGTIPEDIIQTSVDNILTYNSDENRHIFDWENMSENFKQNLIWMAGFNAAKAGISAIKRYKMLKAAAKLADLDQKVEINGLNPDYDDIKRAFNSGGDLQIDGETVKAVDGDGNEVVLKNTTPDQAEMVRRQYGRSDKAPTANLDYDTRWYKGGLDTNFYKFVEANDPIDGVRNNGGSVTSWLAATDVDASVRDATTKERFAQLPKATQININNDANMKYLLKKYSPSVAFQRLGIDAPTSKISLDGAHANTVWYNLMKNQPSAATTATTEPTAVEENVKASVEDINKGVKTSGTLQDKLLQKSKEIYDKRAASANKLKDEGMKQSSLKRAGMEKAARDRLITGELTGKERQALSDRYNKFFRGKDVIVNGQHAVVVEPSVFGRVKVKFDDGTTKVVDPVDAEAQFTTKEDIDKDIFNKFIKKDIEQQLGVNLDEMSAEADTAPVQPWDNDEVSQYRQYVRRSSESGDAEGAKYYGERLDEVEAKAKKDYFSKKLASGDLKDGEFFDANFYANPESGRFKIYDSGELYRGGKNEASKGDTTFYTPKQWYAETYDSNVVRNRNPLNTFVYNSENAFESVYYKLSDAVHSTDSYKNATKAEQRAIDDMLLKMNGGPKDFSDVVGGGKTSKQSGKGTPIPQPIQDGFRKLGIDAVEVPEWAFGGKDLGDTGIGHQTEVIVLNKDRLTGSQPVVEAETTKAETEAPKTTLVGTEDATGRTIEEAPVYNFKNHGDALSAEVKPTKAGVEHWHSNALDATMNEGAQLISDLHAKFGDVEPGDFDWVFQSQKSNIPLDKIVGSTIPGTNRVITQNMIDAMKWWADQPVIKELRQASRAGLGESGDNNTLGYLPHTDYDPSDASYEEAIAGALWKHYTGASMMKDGKYVGYGGTFENRFRTYASNMLWDAKAKDVAASKLVEEAVMDGQQVTPELIANARKVVDKDVNLQKAVNNSPSTRALEKALADVEEKPDFSSIESTAQKEGAKSNLGKAYHDAYVDSGVYSNANSKGVKSQATTFQENFDTLGNNMRKIQLEGGMALYDWGGAAIIYADCDAIELVGRYMRDGGDFRQMLVEYIENHSHRSPEYAEAVADKWMAKIGTIPGELTKGKLISSLAQSMKWEGVARLKKWLAMAKYDELNAASRKTIDSLLFNHLQMNAVKNNKKIGAAITKALDVVTGMRYRALFYGNLKNGLLQVSELGRLFTTFKLGDIAQMAKHMATDADFRARVEMYTDAVAPRTKGLKSALQDARQSLYESYANAAGNMKVESDGVSFGDFYTKFKDSVDNIGLAPIEAAEAYKNHMMVAAIVQEADNLEANGKIKNPTEKMNYIRRRFERVALAADEIGRIGLSSSPLGRFALFLQNFQIRELGMHYYNIKDAILAGTTIPKKVYNVVSYLSKVFGTKMAVTLVLARLGYSATQTLGIDPFGMLDSYNTMDEDEMNFLDEQISHGVLTPLFSGGMTSLIADLYFMGRNAYEDSVRKTVADDAQANLEKDDILDSFKFWERWKLPEDANPLDAALGLAENFAPGATFTKRIGQMNDMMDSGWATSAAGNKQYTAPTDALNVVLGYLFGRNATQNAMQYNQTYGDNLWQTLGRFNPFRSWGEFDPIDTKNYTDWFKGNENDAQQFNKGIYWFRDQRDRILDAYEEAIQRRYSTSEKTEAKNLMNERLGELYTKLERFVKAYEKKNGSITPAMTKQIINLLNTYEDTTNPSQEIDAEQDSLGGYSNAIERYAGLDLPSIGTYTGPTTSEPDKEVSYQGSPQWRAAVSGYHNVDDEVADVLKLVDKTTLAPLRKELKDAISEAYAKKDWDALGRIQKQYLKAFDNAVGPVVAAYGNSILNKGKVENQLEEMLSSGGNSGNLIPSEQYAKNKYGRYQSMEYESVDVGKWAQKRFSGDTYTKPTITSNSTAAEDLVEIKRLIRRGQNDRARARALQLKVRVDNQQRYLSKDDYNWLNDYINYKEGK